MNKPKKPTKPKEPSKTISETPSVKLYDGYYGGVPTYTISELMVKLGTAYPQIGALDKDKVYIDVDVDFYYEDVELSLYVKYSDNIEVVDPEYDKKLKRYKAALKRYPINLATYEAKMVEYNKSLEQKEEDVKQRKIEEARRVLRELGAE